MRLSKWIILAASAGTAGCTVGPDYAPPKINLIEHWGEQSTEATTRPSFDSKSTIVSRPPPLVEWWTTFHDPELDGLIERAVNANLDLRRATARVREARAQRGVVRADLFPTVNADGTIEHARPSGKGVTSAFGQGGGAPVTAGGTGTSTPGAGGSASIPGAGVGEFDVYQAGFDASWEIDVFGGKRRAVESANASIDAAIEDRRDVLLSVMAEVARDYIELRSAQSQLQIAEENLSAQQKTRGLTRELVQRGLTNQFDSARADAQVASTAAQIPTLQMQIGQAVHRLSILLDERPTGLTLELIDRATLPAVPDDVPIGLPSDLLRRRPDIRRAERLLAAATANIGVATADWYPKFSLNGSFGTQALQPGDLPEWNSRYFSYGPSVSWPLFDAGRIRENVHVQEARQEQALIAYRKSVLTALQEVEDGLLSYDQTQKRTVSLKQAVDANMQAVRIASDLYARGLADFLSVLDAQRNLYTSQEELAISQAQTATQLVALYKSLGGGWELDSARQ